jgi:hypothetical protein
MIYGSGHENELSKGFEGRRTWYEREGENSFEVSGARSGKAASRLLRRSDVEVWV